MLPAFRSDETFTEIIDGERTVTLTRQLHEAITSDGMRLALVRKLPVQGAWRPHPLLLLHGLGQNRHAWGLTRRSLANELVAHGFEVFIGELRGRGLSRAAGSLPAARFSDFSDSDLPAMAGYALEQSGADRLFVVGHSLGGITALAAPETLHPRLAGIVAIASPCAMSSGTSLPHHVARALWRLGRLLPQSERLPLAVPFHAIGRNVARLLPAFDSEWTPAAFEMWTPGSIERDLLQELLREGFDAEGVGVLASISRWMGGEGPGGRAEPEILERVAALRAPLLALSGDADVLAPTSDVEGWLSIVGSPDRDLKVCGRPEGPHFGHYDLLLGRFASTEVWPLVTRWLVDRCVDNN